jgi:hypothetical protein
MKLVRLLSILALSCLPACAATPPPASPALPAGLASPFTGYQSTHYRDQAAWLCLPGREDACAASLESTELLPDGSRTVVRDVDAPQRDKVDCFYIYPTVDLSLRPGNHQSFTDTGPMARSTFAQVARFRTVCRLFVPLYRQITLGTYLRDAETRESYLKVAESDVADAFVHYMGQWNGGRKIVILGHSQGAEMATRLLKRFFDEDPLMRDRLLLALPIGGHLDVPKGEAVGGTFAHIPACTKKGETGCVVGFRSFFANQSVDGSWDPATPGDESVCVNPAELDTGAPRSFSRTFFPSGDDVKRYLHGVDGVTTRSIMLRDFYRGQCVKGPNGFRYLAISVAPREGDVRESPVDVGARALRGKLGTHILDFQFPQGDLIDLVARRAASLP